MKDLTHASQQLVALVELLQTSGCFNLTATISHLPSTEGSPRPEIVVELTGSDTPLLTARNGDLLHAIEHIAAKILGLEAEEHDRISFDAGGFKATRDRDLQHLVEAAIVKVQTSASAYVFPPMMSRERRFLHLALAHSGLKSASTGEHFKRSVIFYPNGVSPPE